MLIGEYHPSAHGAMVEAAGLRVPGGDYESHIQSHVRRLEALRRAGIVERIAADRWRIPGDLRSAPPITTPSTGYGCPSGFSTSRSRCADRRGRCDLA